MIYNDHVSKLGWMVVLEIEKEAKITYFSLKVIEILIDEL